MSALALKTEPAKKRILIAEDDEAIASMLQRILGTRFAVDHAGDGKRALVIAAAMKPQLLLLDVMLPGIDGFEVADRVRRLPGLQAMPIIFLTARSSPLDVVKGIQAHARHYVTKPFQLTDLLEKVTRLLDAGAPLAAGLASAR